MGQAISERDYLKTMIREAMSAPILDPDVEQELTRKWCNEKCEESLGLLTTSHMRMAVSAAIKFKGYGLPLSDLIQEGAIGLLEAAKRFDPGREVRFCTYAGWWIRASIQDYVLRNWSIVRIGSKSAHKTIFFNLSRIRAMIEEVDYDYEHKSKVAERFKVSVDDIEFMTSRLGGRDTSLNTTFGDDSDTERQDMVADERELPDQTVGARLDADKRSRWLAGALAQLSSREQDIIRQRFFSDERVTLSQLGAALGLSKERVRQIEKQAIGKLRDSLQPAGASAPLEAYFN